MAGSPHTGKHGALTLLLALVTAVIAFKLLGVGSLAVLSWPALRRATLGEVEPTAPAAMAGPARLPGIDFPDLVLHVHPSPQAMWFASRFADAPFSENCGAVHRRWSQDA